MNQKEKDEWEVIFENGWFSASELLDSSEDLGVPLPFAMGMLQCTIKRIVDNAPCAHKAVSAIATCMMNAVDQSEEDYDESEHS